MAFKLSDKSTKKLFRNSDFWFAIILISAFIIRLYYLILTKGQAMWWDEAEYMSAAKYWGMGVPYELNEQRPPLFQLLGAGLIKLGFGEIALKFILVLLPSVALVAATYYLGKELFNSKIALIGALGAAFVWSLLFWSVRFQPDFFSVTFQLIAFLFFWKFIKSGSKKHAVYTGLFCAAGFYFKISALLVPLCIGLFLLYKEGWKAVKAKNNWTILGAFIVGMIPFMIWQVITFGNPLAFGVTYSGDFNVGRSLGWEALGFYELFLQVLIPLFFIGGVVTWLLSGFSKGKNNIRFWIGLAVILALSFYLVYSKGKLVGLFIASFLFLLIKVYLRLKDKSKEKDPWMFVFIVLLVVSSFYIFYIKGTIEDRWVFLMIPFIFFFVGKFVYEVTSSVSSDSKFLAALIILFALLFIIWPQINYASGVISSKKDAYLPIKEASLLIKENSEPADKILSVSYTQTTAYAERQVITYSNMPIENFTEILQKERPRFVMVSIWEPHHPGWMLQQAQNEQGFRGTLFPYFNSTIIVSPQNQIVQYDVKQKVSNEVADFTLVYPVGNQYGGVLVYRIDYK
jgi:4-amino-4-deoxy-L-arabinose transferase-like glycosyltransferase